VLGHELTHIRNGDVRMLVIAVIIAGVIGFVAELVFRMLFQGGLRFGGRRSSSSGDRGRGGAGIAILIAAVLIAVAWLLSTVIRFALSRRREYLADAGSVELTKDPDAMISALRKIENRGELEGSPSAVMEMCVDNPRQGFADLFATHPPIESRIAALVQYAGGHDPGPLSLPGPDDLQEQEPPSPWGSPDAESSPDKPFLPSEPPVSIGGAAAPDQSSSGSPVGPWGPVQPPGPWGPRREN
jgi:heat shock protein HtpX